MSMKDKVARITPAEEAGARGLSLMQSLNALRESEDRYRSLFEAMGDGMALHEIICDRNGHPCDYRFLEVNAAYEEATGLSRERLVGKTVKEVLPEIETYWIQTYGEVALTGRTMRFENFSHELNKHFRVTAYSPKKGQFVTVLLDITERKLAEIEALQKATEVQEDLNGKGLLSDELSKQLQESQALYDISQILAGTVDLSVTLQLIADAAANLIKTCSQAILHLLDEREKFLISVAISGSDIPSKRHRMNFKLGEGIAGLALSTGQTINVSDVLSDPRYLPVQSSTRVLSRSLLVAPVKTGEKILGTLSVQSPVPNVFNIDDERLLTTLGAQAAVAIEKAQLLTTEREQRELAEALSQISSIVNKTLDIDTVLDLLLDQVGKLAPYDFADFMLVQDSVAHVVRSRGYESETGHVEKPSRLQHFELAKWPWLAKIVETRKPVIIPSIKDETEGFPIGDLADIQSWAAAPVIAQDEVIALFSLSKCEEGFFGEDHGARLEAFANQAALALQNARLFATIQKRLKEVNILYQINQELAGSLEIDEMVRHVAELLQEFFGFYYVQVYLVDIQTGDLFLAQGSGEIGEQLKKTEKRARIGEGVIGHVALSASPFMANNVETEEFYVPEPNLPDTYAELALPVKAGNRLLGVLDIHHQAPNGFTENDLRLMNTVADQLAVSIEKALLYDDLQASLQQEKAARAQLVQSEKLAALGRIVASVAHELNNPLQAIQNALYLINIEETLTPQAREDLKTVLNEVERMAELITRLRETYRPAASEEFQPESLNGLVTEVQKLLGTHLRRNQISFEFHPDPNLPEIPLIRDQAKQVILNICLNAVEAMPEGGRLSVETLYDSASAGELLIVSDTGPAISPKILPYIFDPFVTTKEGGTGLGLAITYDIVRRHNGHIDVISEEDKGTAFKVWWPIQQHFDHVE
jgi:PAS domain S-box-containing protein